MPLSGTSLKRWNSGLIQRESSAIQYRNPRASLPELFGTQDLQRLDRELDHLRELGLVSRGIIPGSSNTAELTLSPLALHLYVRAQGSKLSPTTYWNLTPPTSDRSDSEAFS